MTENDKWPTVEELAAYLKMSRIKLHVMTQKEQSLASKIGSQWRFDRDEGDDWMNSKKWRS